MRVTMTTAASNMIGVVALAIGLEPLLMAQQPHAVGTWASIGATSEARSGAAAVTLGDGRTLVIGGLVADGTETADVSLFDIATHTTTTIGQLQAARSGHTATLLEDGRVLVVGGERARQTLETIEIFDPEAGASATVGSLGTPRTRHAAAALPDGQVLIAGGVAEDNAVLASAEIFDPVTASSGAVPGSMLTARRDASATTLLDGRVLIAGGHDGAGDLASAEMFYSSYGFFALEPATFLSVPRSGHTALLLPDNNSVLIAGGTSNGAAVAAVDLFLPAEFPDPYTYGVGRFTPAASMNLARARAISAAAGRDGLAFVAGGGASDTELYRFPTLKTDLDDYYPGQHAVISGSGWPAGEEVTLLFQEDPPVHDDYVVQVTSDAEGNIYTDAWAPDEHDLGVRFYLTAFAGPARAQITFTDAVNLASAPAFSAASGSTCGAAITTVTVGAPVCATSTLQTNPGSTAQNYVEFRWFRPGETAAAFVQRYPEGGGVLGQRVVVSATTVQSPDTPGTWTVKVCHASSACNNSSTTLITATIAVTSPDQTLTVSGTGAGFGTITSTPAGISCTISAGSASGNCSAAFLQGSVVELTATASSTSPTPVGSTFDGWSGSGMGDTTRAITMSANESVSAHFKANQTITFDAVPSKTFGDAPFTVAAIASSALSTDVAVVSGPATVAGNTVTLTGAGTVTLRARQVGNADYNPAADVERTFTVEKAIPQCNVEGFTGTYDGDSHGASGQCSGVDGSKLSGLDLGASFIEVPGGTAYWSFAGDANYRDQSGSATIVIEKALAVVNVLGKTVTYDGNEHGATGTAVGVKGENLSTSLNLGETFTNAPGGSAEWSFSGGTNYTDQSGTVAIVINRADANVTVNNYYGVYNGQPHGATGSATGVKKEDLSHLLTLGDTFINVPGGTAHWSFAGTGNYKPASGTATIVITKAEQSISWPEPAPIVYGTALSGAQLNAVVVAGDGALTHAPPAGTILPVGTHLLFAYAAETGNYNPASKTVTITVNPWHLTGFYQPVTMSANNGLVFNTVKGGSTVPLKFNVYASAGGAEIISVASISGFSVYPMSCAGSLEDPVEFTAAGGTSLRYDSLARQFIQNWQTPKGGGQCYQVTMTTSDGSTLSAFFKTK